MLIESLSTFPRMYDSVMGSSMMKRAQDKGILEFRAHDLRDWTHDRHRTTDDDPYGGGAGLVMKCEPIFSAVEDIIGGALGNAQSLKQSCFAESASGAFQSCGTRFVSTTQGAFCEHAPSPSACPPERSAEGHSPSYHPEEPEETKDLSPARVIFLAPQGRQFTDAYASELAEADHLLFICGHYEGIDERVYALADDVISLGDYVLTSGELASMIVIDAVVRKIPGVLGAEDGPVDESFTSGLLEYPQYTRPASFRGMDVPEVLLSGNHAAIAQWRREQSLARTARLRPDMLAAFESAGNLTPADRKFLKSLSNHQDIAL